MNSLKAFLLLLYLLILLIIFSCGDDASNIGGETEPEIAAESFIMIEKILEKDGGRFWNKSLDGPLLFVNPNTRVFYANRNNLKNSFEKTGSVFVDTLPVDINISNTAFDWEGLRWTMVMLPPPASRADRINLLVHELFHGVQPELGFDSLYTLDNSHLDTFDGRVMLKMELEALKNALSEKREEAMKRHIRNALSFRFKRYTTLDIKEAENSLEINEGLAEYTGVMLSGRTEEEFLSHFMNRIERFYDNPTFVRSFAYETTPIYGYLLSLKIKDWHKDITRQTNLSDYFRDKFNVVPVDDINGIISGWGVSYNYKKINEDESAREDERIAAIEKYKNLFFGEASLILPFQNMRISFNPLNIMPLEDLGTVYPNLRITDNWGILSADSGALVSSDWSSVRVAAPKSIGDSLVEGNGWKLELKNGWRILKTADSYELKLE